MSSKGNAGNYRNVCLIQKPFRQHGGISQAVFLKIMPDVRVGVKGAVGRNAMYARYRLQSRDETIPAVPVLSAHLIHVGLWPLDGRQGRFLSDGRRV